MAETGATPHEEHFESLARQREAVRLGMWVFIAAETLLFAALFALYATARNDFEPAFKEGVKHNLTLWGSSMTVVLLVSSFLIAWAVHALRDGHERVAAWLATGTAALGLGFIAMKLYEYTDHLKHGIVPGGGTHFFEENGTEGLVAFFNLYWLMTGLHFLHVAIGIGLLLFFAQWLFRRKLPADKAHVLETGALYWHMVDAIWIFLWPMFYLMGHTG